MQAWSELLTSFTGLLSLGVIIFVIGMGGYIGWYARCKIREEEASGAPR